MMELNTTNEAGITQDERKKVYETIQYIVIRLGDEQYGIDIRNIDNIVRMQHITRVPKMPAYLKGVINMRGEVIPVMSMRLMMNLADDEVLEQEGNVGFIVDEVKEVVSLSVNNIEKVNNNSKDEKTDLISAVGKHNGELISLVDLSAINFDDN